MCGIAGFLNLQKTKSRVDFEQILKRMTDSIIHRGPDQPGMWFDEKVEIGMGFRRLAIQDLNPNANQPMQSSCGRYVISFNGEIYNFLSLRTELEKSGHIFNTRSDTEVLLCLITKYGFEKALEVIVGMFAIALWDKKEETLFLARDRMGEKPLYYGICNGVLIYASELSALKKHPSFNASINTASVESLLRYSCIPAPLSIYEGIHKLLPAHFAAFSLRNPGGIVKNYWSLSETLQDSELSFINFDDAANELEKLLAQSVSEQMTSDVPLGAFLSAGVDSSCIVSFMQSLTNKKVKTFTVGFDDSEYNEAASAKRIAAHLKTDHYEIYLNEKDALKIVPSIASIYAEPFGDSSQIPTVLISRFAKQHVTVCLSGDGGDEVFAGYNRYRWGLKLWRQMSTVPLVLRKLFATALQPMMLSMPNSVTRVASFLAPSIKHEKSLQEKIFKFVAAMDANSIQNFYEKIISNSMSSVRHCLKDKSLFNKSILQHQSVINKNDLRFLQYKDMHWYLPDDILTKVDRASMSVSLEMRSPFLDHRIVEYVWKLPRKFLINNATSDTNSKKILREVLYRKIPSKYFESKKSGFSVPLGKWLRGELKNWASDLLKSETIKQQGLLDPIQVQKSWKMFQNGCPIEHSVWNLLMFQAWMEKNT